MLEVKRTFALVALAILLPMAARAEEWSGQSYVGQKFILRRFGGIREVKVKKKQVKRFKRGCDVAVEVKFASFEDRKLRFEFGVLGNVQVQSSVISCPTDPELINLTITNFEAAESGVSLRSCIEEFLQTPETFLASEGITLEPPNPAGDAVVIVKFGPGITVPEKILSVVPIYPVSLRAKPVQGKVAALLDIGTNGVVREYRLIESPHPDMSKAVEAIFPLFRFRPARQGDEARRSRIHYEVVMAVAPGVAVLNK